MAKQTTPAAVEAESAADALRRFWKIGDESWRSVDPERHKKPADRVKNEYAHGNKLDILHAEAEKLGVNHDTLKKAWKVAREYTFEQIEEWCALIVDCGARFSATHLTRLLSVKDRKQRDRLTRSAIRERWGLATLGRKLQSLRGRRPKVGKKPAIPKTEPELLTALDALSDKWIRWCTAAAEDIPDEIRDAVERATAAVVRVKNQIASKLQAPDESA